MRLREQEFDPCDDPRRSDEAIAALLLEPHQDDGVLFSAFNAIRHRAYVVTVFADSRNQPWTDGHKRNLENEKAYRKLGLEPPLPWDFPDKDPPYDDVMNKLRTLSRKDEWEHVFAPFPEVGGHPQHNWVGNVANELFRGRVTWYTTYKFGGPRTIGDVVPYETEWLLRKLRALAHFESQILHGPHRFFAMGLNEYVELP